MRAPVLLAAAVLLLSCRRYALRPVECEPEPTARSDVRWQATSGAPVLTGRVLRADSAVGLHDASVRVEPLRHVGAARAAGAVADSARVTRVDATGAFALGPLAPGVYRVTARRFAYVPAVDTVRLAPDSGALIVVALRPEMVTLDGCGYAHVMVRRPWWDWR